MLAYLVFDAHESTEGVSSFEAMASVNEARWPALQAELAQVLAWCHEWGRAHDAPDPMALDEGGEWDHSLRVSREVSETLEAAFDPHLSTLRLAQNGGVLVRYDVTLTLSGREAFAADFGADFLSD